MVTTSIKALLAVAVSTGQAVTDARAESQTHASGPPGAAGGQK
jgi:hypothetical protein